MHNASTKQRLAALRRKLGIFTGWQPRWVKQRAKRLAAQRAREDAAAAAAAAEAPTELVAPSVHAETEPEALSATVARETPLSEDDVPALETPLSPWQRQGERARERGPARIDSAVPSEPIVAIAPAPAAPVRRRTARTAAAVALAAAVLAVLAVLALRDPAAPAPGLADPEAAARSPERDTRASVALASTPSPAAPRPLAGPDRSTLEVRRGDTLWHLASVHLGDPMRWPELHAANASQIGDPDLIFPGQRLRVPAGGGAPL